MRCWVFGPRGDNGIASTVDAKRHTNTFALNTILSQMHHKGRPNIGNDNPQSPGKAISEEDIVRMLKGCLGEQGSFIRNVFPLKLITEAIATHLPRRILDLAAFSTRL